MRDCLAGLLPRYRQLAERGQVELSMTPYMHPIVPLLNDFQNMRCALPDAPAPHAADYPEGVERSRWHLQRGIEVFEHYFGRKPQGVWLSEGGVSEDAVACWMNTGFAGRLPVKVCGVIVAAYRLTTARTNTANAACLCLTSCRILRCGCFSAMTACRI